MSSHSPEELGIPFPEITAVNIGLCPGDINGGHYMEVTPFRAHTHTCPKDKYYKNICIWTKDHLFNSDGSISDIIWHEYAHVLDAKYSGVYVTGCKITRDGSHISQLDSFDSKAIFDESIANNGHGKPWADIMIKFGKEPSLYCTPPR